MTDYLSPQRISDARPIEEGFSRLRCPDCCAYSLTLIRGPAKKASAYHKVRVTALPGTAILAADPDDWYQTANFPASVTWYTGAALPAGDPQDSWIVDNDFSLSLGPVSPGIKSIRVEWLGIKDKVLSSQRIDVPCLGSGDDYDFETEWERYTVVEKGREDTFAYLEPDDCDLDVTDTLKTTSCIIAPFAPTCAGGGQYTVVLQETTTGSSGLYKYTWTINTKSGSVVTTVIGNNVSVDLPPGSYEVVLDLLDNNGDSVGECSATLDLLAPEPAFTWSQVDCEQEIELDASSTENAHLVSTWEWSCSDPSIIIDASQQSAANFASVGAGSYLVTLKITDIYGCTWEQAQTVKVVDCEASFTHKYSWCVDRIDPNIKKDVQVTFTNTSVGCPPFTCKWVFGDGDVSIEVNPVHTYKQAAHGQSFQVVLTMTDSKGCSKKVTEFIAVQQRTRPDFEVKVCPDGKVICTTNAPNPTWDTTGAPKTAPWPYTKKKKGRIIYKFETPGTYFISLTSTDENSNECVRRKEIVIKLECCAKNARVRRTSGAISATVGNKSVELRVKGRLAQVQTPFAHRVKAKTILQRKNSKGRWRRYRSSEIRIEAGFEGKIFRSDANVFNWFDGSYYGGCNCMIEAKTEAFKGKDNARRVKAKDQIGKRFRSKLNSILSKHNIVVGGVLTTMLSLSLGEEADCTTFNWWTDWF